MLDLCAAPGGKARAAARRGDGGRDRPGPRARAAGEPREDGSRRRDGRRGGRHGAAAGARRLRPRARRRAVLRPRRARAAARPPLARDTAPGPPARAAPLRRRARAARRHDPLLRLHAEPRGVRGGCRRERPARPAARARSGRHSRTRRVRSSCSRSRTFTARAGSSSLVSYDRPDELAGLGAERRGRAVALRGGLRAPRGADRRCS